MEKTRVYEKLSHKTVMMKKDSKALNTHTFYKSIALGTFKCTYDMYIVAFCNCIIYFTVTANNLGSTV